MFENAGAIVSVCRSALGWILMTLPCSLLDSTSDSVGSTEPAPTLALGAGPQSVPGGGVSTLTWRSQGATSCHASGGWSGARSVSGQARVGPIDQDTGFRLSCSGAGGGVVRQVTVSVDDKGPPTVTLEARPSQVETGGSTTLAWSAQGATACTAKGGWRGPLATSGSFGTGPMSASASFSVSCGGPHGHALATVTVEVLDKVLRWHAPTRNVDGSPLTDLAGYKIYWGTESRAYAQPPHVVDGASVTEWEVPLPAGTYYFALTAFDGDGTESGLSNEVIKTIP